MKQHGRLLVAGLLVVLGTACSPAEARVRVVEVTIEHSRFRPAVISVEPGSTVRFVVHNRDPIAHEFLIGDEAAQLRHETGTEPKHGARSGELSIPAGESRVTTYTFPLVGSRLIGCHLPGHYDYGMRGAIRIG